MIAKIKRRPLPKRRQKRPAPDCSARAFESMLSEIRYFAWSCFGQLDLEAREEATQEAIVHALVTYRRLVELGKASLLYPAVLARCGVLRVKDGRKVGSPKNSQDVLSQQNVPVERIDHYNQRRQCWRQLAVEDRRAGPAEVACLRIDFSDWLDLQPPRNRQIAESLAIGHTPREIARRFSISQARISQLRQIFRESWNTFQDEPPVAAILRDA